MKISVNSTFSYIKFNLNYGSALQCYALQAYLCARGHDATLLRDYRANPVYIAKRLKYIRHFRTFVAKVRALRQLQKFIRRNISLSKHAYFSARALTTNCPQADCHIAGSDQIWHSANPARYLTYAPDNKLKLAYAASFGRASISDDMKQTIKPYLERLAGISVREASGVRIVDSLGLSAQQVLDPTLLLDMAQYPYQDGPEIPYCYCYFLNLDRRENIPFAAIEQYSKQHTLQLHVTAPLNYDLFLDQHLLFPSVEEWLGLYKRAECVFTNTYHGLLFCIIFEKPFCFFAQKGHQANENERFTSILEMLGLTDRIVDMNAAHAIETLLEKPIDYKAVRQKISGLRERTDQFFAAFGI